MNKILYFLLFSSISFFSYSSSSPNEEKIYYHIHQATRWAELYYSKKTLFANQEMRNHLGKIKFSEVKLINSAFYKEFIYLNKLSLDLNQSTYGDIEKFRAKVHSKAKQLKVKHPENWQDEFALIR